MKIDQKIYRLRKEKGWSQQQLADRLGVTRQAVSKWEGGQSLPDIQMVVLLSEVFEVSTDSLLKEEDEDEPLLLNLQKTEQTDGENDTDHTESGTRSTLYEISYPTDFSTDESPKDETILEGQYTESKSSIHLDLDKDEPESVSFDSVDEKPSAGSYRSRPEVTLSLEEVNHYIQIRKLTALEVGLGVFFCILSPAPLILLTGLQPYQSIFRAVFFNEEMAGILGVIILLCCVAIAVALFIHASYLIKKYKFIERGDFRLDEQVRYQIEQRAQSYQKFRILFLIIGVCLCILSPVPLIFSAAFFSYWEGITIMGVAILLSLVACGVFLMVFNGIIQGMYDQLLQINEYSPDNKAK